MNKLTRLSKIWAIPMIFILPFWLTFGRTIFGVGGWGVILYLFTLAPFIIISLTIVNMLIKRRLMPDGKLHLGITDSIILLCFYIFTFLHGLFLVDGGDTPESVSSFATKVLGKSFEDTSQYLASLFLSIAFLTLITVFVVAIYERVRRPLR